jgi:hypothetical protein
MMSSIRLRIWLWQLSYALFGLSFFVGLFLAIASWNLGGSFKWIALALGSILLLVVLNRRLNSPRIRSNACSRCGHDITGIPAGAPCPECGSPNQTPFPETPFSTKTN